MGFLLMWIIFAVIVGAIATDRAMGFWGGFLWSFLLSPIIGVVIVLCSKSKATLLHEQQMYYNQQQQTNVLHQMQQQNKPSSISVSVADELAKLKKLSDDGVLTKEEYDTQKKKLLEQN